MFKTEISEVLVDLFSTFTRLCVGKQTYTVICAFSMHLLRFDLWPLSFMQDQQLLKTPNIFTLLQQESTKF